MGILIAGLISLTISSLFIDCSFQKIMRISLRSYLKKISVGSITGAVALSLCFVYSVRFVTSWNFGKIFLSVLCFFVIYIAIIKFTKEISDSDRELLRQFLTIVKFAR